MAWYHKVALESKFHLSEQIETMSHYGSSGSNGYGGGGHNRYDDRSGYRNGGGGYSGGGGGGHYGRSDDRGFGGGGKLDKNIQWDLSKLPVFEKNFYIEHPAVSGRSEMRLPTGAGKKNQYSRTWHPKPVMTFEEASMLNMSSLRC